MSPILVAIFWAIIFPSPKLPKAHKVALDSPRPMSKITHPLTLLWEAPVIRKVKVGTGSGEEQWKCIPWYFVDLFVIVWGHTWEKCTAKQWTMNILGERRIIAHYLGGSYDRHIYFVVFCTGCVVRSVPPTQEYSSQRAIFSSSVPGHSSLPKYWRVASNWHAS